MPCRHVTFVGAAVALAALAAPRTAEASPAPWVRVAAPSPGAVSVLHDVSASASDTAWAVGETHAVVGAPAQPLILRVRDGTWVPAVVPDNLEGVLDAVLAFGPDDVWAGGVAYRITGPEALLLRWDGHRWTRASSGPSTRPGASVTGLAGSGPSDVWALGTLRPLHRISLEPRVWGAHYDGTVWQTGDARFRPYHGAGVEDVAASGRMLVAGGWALETGLKAVWGVGDGQRWDFTQRLLGPRTRGAACAPPDLPGPVSSPSNRCAGLLGVALRADGASIGVGESSHGAYAAFAPTFGQLPIDNIPPGAASGRLLAAAACPGSTAPFVAVGSILDPSVGAQRPWLLGFDGSSWTDQPLDASVLDHAATLRGVAVAPDGSGFAVGSVSLAGGAQRSLVAQTAAACS
jgi:hypothetical protein